MCEIKASQIFKRNKESEHTPKQSVLQMIKDVSSRGTIASARAQAAGDENFDDLDSLDADDDEEYEAFLEELYSPSF